MSNNMKEMKRQLQRAIENSDRHKGLVKKHKPIDPRRLVDNSYAIPERPGKPQQAFVDRANGVVVQVWHHATPLCEDTPWEGSLRVSVLHTDAKTPTQLYGESKRTYAIPITWDELQAIKDHFWPEKIAIEIYPPKDQLVNVADLRWLWVLPKGAVLPFNLEAADKALRS